MQEAINQLRTMVEQNQFAYRKAVLLLAALGLQGRDIEDLRQHVEKPYAPREAEAKALAFIHSFYARFCTLVLSQGYLNFNQEHKPTVYVEKVIVDVVKEVKSDDPAIIVKLRQQQRQKRDERRAIHITIEETDDVKLRAEKARRVRELSQEIDKIFNLLDDYEENGTIPAIGSDSDLKLATMEIMDLMTTRKSLTERISRLKSDKFLGNDKLLPSKRFRFTEELKIKEAELIRVKEKIYSLN